MRAGDRPFTCPGLGDRVHSVLLAHQYAKGEPVTIHVTDDKWSIAGGVKSDKKPKSWREIIELFPSEIQIENHDVENLKEEVWLDYLFQKGYDAETYHYGDVLDMHPNDFSDIGMDVSELLKELPELDKQEKSKMICCHFDTTDLGRQIPPMTQEMIINKYRAEGYAVVTLSGKLSLKQCAHFLARSEYFVGIDSGMLHMAMLYLPYEKLRIYNKGYRSHHLVRAVANGSELNKDVML